MSIMHGPFAQVSRDSCKLLAALRVSYVPEIYVQKELLYGMYAKCYCLSFKDNKFSLSFAKSWCRLWNSIECQVKFNKFLYQD